MVRTLGLGEGYAPDLEEILDLEKAAERGDPEAYVTLRGIYSQDMFSGELSEEPPEVISLAPDPLFPEADVLVGDTQWLRGHEPGNGGAVGVESVVSSASTAELNDQAVNGHAEQAASPVPDSDSGVAENSATASPDSVSAEPDSKNPGAQPSSEEQQPVLPEELEKVLEGVKLFPRQLIVLRYLLAHPGEPVDAESLLSLMGTGIKPSSALAMYYALLKVIKSSPLGAHLSMEGSRTSGKVWLALPSARVEEGEVLPPTEELSGGEPNDFLAP